jgi:hypothetical protein
MRNLEMENDQSADKPEASQSQPSNDAADEHQVTLEQFAIELSIRDRRVPLVNSFVFVEKQAARFKDTESAYQQRYDAFVDAPV